MKKTSITLAAAMIALGAVSAQAQWTYVDAIDFSLHPLSPTQTGDPGFGQENTFLSGGAPFVTTANGAGTDWRYRNTGPGGVAWDAATPGGAGSAYSGRANEGDPPVFTTVTGLTPNTEYSVRLYGVWTGRNNTWGLSYSLDGGTVWSGTVDRDTIEYAHDFVGTGDWVDNSTALGASVPFVVGDNTDTRAYIFAGSTLTDGLGNLVVGVKGQPNTTTERGVYDGIAFAPGLVPEPTTFALLGLGGAAMLIFRRRS